MTVFMTQDNFLSTIPGIANVAANGYTFLPGGLLLQWGQFVANSTSKITFPLPFPTNCLSVVVTPGANSTNATSYSGANTIVVVSTNTTVANLATLATPTTQGNTYFI